MSPIQKNTLDSFVYKSSGKITKETKMKISAEKYERLFVRLERIDISDKLHTIPKSTKKTSRELKADILHRKKANKSFVKKEEKSASDDIKFNVNLSHKDLETFFGKYLPVVKKNKGTSDEDSETNGKGSNKYKCNQCGKMLKTQRSLGQHVKKLHEPKPIESRYQCYHCDKVVKHKKSLKMHIKQWHTEGEKLFQCDSCTYRTNLRSAFRMHIYRAHLPDDQKPTFQCKQCPHVARLEPDLRKHVARVHLRKIKMKKCNQCDWVGDSARYSIHMIGKHSDQEFCCDKCSFKTKSKANLANHVSVHSELRPFKCPICPYRANYQNTIQNHLKCHEDTYKKCPECSKIIKESNFTEHVLRGHKAVKKKKCPVCSGMFVSLKYHLETHREDRKRLQCPQCTYSIISPFHLRQHIRLSHGDGEKEIFICYLCNMKTTTKAYLSEHIKAVHSTEPCECHLCVGTFKSKVHLRVHMNSVHRERTKWFECDLCPYKAKRPYILKWHRVSHLSKEEVTMFTCQYCPYEAKVPASLRKHVRKYHTSMQF